MINDHSIDFGLGGQSYLIIYYNHEYDERAYGMKVVNRIRG